MESTDLRIFQAVARAGSITKAAEQLGYVQSNVTTRIQLLESELSTALFYRHNRGMKLTSSGIALLQYTDKILGLINEATQALSSTHEPSGSLQIGSTQTAAAVRLPKLLSAYYHKYPKVQLSLITAPTQKLINKVLHYELDAAIIGTAFHHPDLQVSNIYEEELLLVSAPDITDLEIALTKPILVFSNGCSYRETLEQFAQSKGISPTIMEFGTLEAILGGVKAGLGISLLAKSVIGHDFAQGKLHAFEMPDPYRYKPSQFIMRKNSTISKALSALIEMLPIQQEVEIYANKL
ncbi:DNA-binding transcriptional regulator, LysR family [Seinonella peptonophila]|uniref:DNA-binding transcriptional regulator, LysR family n=1 Tax=Seinonella peptonophila TaxID=112248 RepID=A0A1M4VIH9_9BACL|nr:LysR family transcriptional regulator [Seinonella peptonophila]SHE68657.1 DNA-binding transcriptional regulator, LysR family [Seinonella peptonophila]